MAERGMCLEGWVWGNSNFCPNCQARTSCTDCARSADCVYCSDNTCIDLVPTLPPTCLPKVGSCTCEIHDHCAPCAADKGCWWCQEKRRCLPITTPKVNGCTNPPPGCPACSAIVNCQQCAQQPGCDWCGSCVDKGSCPVSSPPVVNCDSYCRQQTSCEPCLFSQGCGWCKSASRCEGLDMVKLQPCPEPFASECPRPSSFDAGSFFGGMALIVGLAAAGAAVFFIVVSVDVFRVSHLLIFSQRYYSRRSAYSSV